MVFHDWNIDKHDFVKTALDKWWNLCVFTKISMISLDRFHCTYISLNGYVYINISVAYRYYRYNQDQYLSNDTHIDTLISFPSIYINIIFFRFCQKYFTEKYWLHTLACYRMMIPIFNITLFTFNPMVIFMCSPQFSIIWGFTPFAKWILAKIAQITIFCLYFQPYFINTYHVSKNYWYNIYRINKCSTNEYIHTYICMYNDDILFKCWYVCNKWGFL